MQYATIHIQANPFVSIWFSRFENCSYLASRSSSADMREREREREATKETLILSSPLLLFSSPLTHPGRSLLPSRTLWCIGGRKTRTRRSQARGEGGGRQLHCSPILVRADSHEQRRSRAASGGGNRRRRIDEFERRRSGSLIL